MAIPAKHVFKTINDQLCTIVEKGVGQDRVDFLKTLLEHNGYEVVVAADKKKKEEDPDLFTIAVTDLTFNPVTAVFGRELKTLDGRKVTADYWEQKTEKTIPQYFLRNKKDY